MNFDDAAVAVMAEALTKAGWQGDEKQLVQLIEKANLSTAVRLFIAGLDAYATRLLKDMQVPPQVREEGAARLKEAASQVEKSSVDFSSGLFKPLGARGGPYLLLARQDQQIEVSIDHGSSAGHNGSWGEDAIVIRTITAGSEPEQSRVIVVPRLPMN